jgi:hypothetical protein
MAAQGSREGSSLFHVLSTYGKVLSRLKTGGYRHGATHFNDPSELHAAKTLSDDTWE